MTGDGTRHAAAPAKHVATRTASGRQEVPGFIAVLRTARGEAALVWKHRQEREGKSEEGGEISGDKGDGAQTTGRMTHDQDDGRKWVEEGNQRLTMKEEFYFPTMRW